MVEPYSASEENCVYGLIEPLEKCFLWGRWLFAAIGLFFIAELRIFMMTGSVTYNEAALDLLSVAM